MKISRSFLSPQNNKLSVKADYVYVDNKVENQKILD